MIAFRLPNDAGLSSNAPNVASVGIPGSPLLLFLPATRAVPERYEHFLGLAASLGFHTLALDYANRGLSLVKLCAGDTDCYAAVQQNRLDGSHPNRWSAISPADAIIPRLIAALAELERIAPEGEWGRFCSAGTVRWSELVVAGHSQGGGQAAFIAHAQPVRGALMFSAPAQTDAGVPASWLLGPSVTPADRMFGLTASTDVYAQRIAATWRTMELDDHGIVTDLDLGSPGEAHRRSIDDSTPLDDSGRPVLQPVWRSMLESVWSRGVIAIS
jgi:hypothetical protein